ncbi:gephyrin-like molybdotransferase receptor GlpR [Mycobacterium sp. D16R24]|uniref:divisome protein SepX/GlpR n=1 Tax=Mycobacterium sp. D16R24 TaxID=1855656 RepID=UPI0009935779|nr:gephyrin-like molybdotransferase receptor GlpR [Mycobacterium sp. D16R24]
MPSIPQSVLWIGLVVLWLFVLVPMLINKRDVVKRTSDVALATRVLNGKAAKLLRRTGPAAGHRSDPDFRREDVDELEDEDDEDSTGVIASAPTEEDKDAAQAVKAMAVRKVRSEKIDSDDPVDVVDEDASALPAGEAALSDDLEDLEEAPVTDANSGTYEYVDDTSGLTIPAESTRERHQAPPMYSSSRRRRFDPDTMAKENARKFAFRKRVLIGLVAAMTIAGVVAATATSTAWWVCGALAVMAVLYLGYLRRQTRIEEQLRRRRAARYQRARVVGVENVADRELDVVPQRLRRPGAAVLEIDDEDPVFEHLDYYDEPRQYRMPHAVGQ